MRASRRAFKEVGSVGVQRFVNLRHPRLGPREGETSVWVDRGRGFRTVSETVGMEFVDKISHAKFDEILQGRNGEGVE